MISQEQRTWHGANPRVEIIHRVVCASCEAKGPGAFTDGKAHDLAIYRGWSSRNILISDVVLTIYTCPNCMRPS